MIAVIDRKTVIATIGIWFQRQGIQPKISVQKPEGAGNFLPVCVNSAFRRARVAVAEQGV